MNLKLTDSVMNVVGSSSVMLFLGFLLDLIRGAVKPVPRLAKVRVPVTSPRRAVRPRNDMDGCRW